MRIWIAFFALMIGGHSWSSSSPDEEEVLLRFNLETTRYFELKEFYVTNGKLLKIDKSHYEEATTEDLSTLFPRISIARINEAVLKDFLEDISSIGLFKWENRYPHPEENEDGFLCHFRWSLIVITSHQENFSEGHCAGPENLQDFIKRTNELFENVIPFSESQPNHGFNRTPEGSGPAKPGGLDGGAG